MYHPTATSPALPHPHSKAALWLSLGALALLSWNHCANTHKQRVTNRSKALPEPLQTWEGEGGQSPVVPATTAQAET